MFCANVIKKKYRVSLEKSGARITMEVCAESMEAARIQCETNGWKMVSVQKIED